ncbi:MAG: Gfo/Idh/MocA family oxidoreductase [Chloroflexia bacterium]|nr:Gfo/Idh/MocA family oxidoreductase [Chloroflexia bacterium]
MSSQHAGSPLRIGILGAGNIARLHSVGWNEFPENAHIAAYSDVDTVRAKFMSDTHTGGTAKTYDSIDAIVADPEIDVIDICLPHHLHVDAVLKAAQAGKAILCEKPLCTNLSDAAKIRETIASTGVIFMGAHNNLFTPSLLEARRLLSGGFIGKPFMYRTIEVFQSRGFDPWSKEASTTGGGQRGWRADLRTSGGGELLDTGYHSTYRLLSLASGDRPVEVTGFLSRFLQSHLPTEDTGHVFVRFESGAVGEILTSWALDVVGARQFEIEGEFGALAGSATSLSHQLYRWPEPSTRSYPAPATFTLEIGHFIEVVKNGATNAAPIDDTIRTLQLIKAAYLSAKLGATVSLPEDPAGIPVPRETAVVTPYSVDVPDEVLG